MAAATNTNNAGSSKGGEIESGIIQPTQKAGDDGKKNENTGSGFEWAYFWLAVLIAVFALLWHKGYINSMAKFVAETREQLRKCTWPTMDELRQHIVVVMISSVLLGIFTVASDQIVQFVVWDLLMGS